MKMTTTPAVASTAAMGSGFSRRSRCQRGPLGRGVGSGMLRKLSWARAGEAARVRGSVRARGARKAAWDLALEGA
jgi:hypothetical protein